MNGLFTKRQLASLDGIGIVLKKLFKTILKADFAAVTALFVILGQLFGAFVNDTPVTPYGDAIDMSRFELVWEDDFENGFDTTRWQGHYVYGADDTQKRDVAYWNREQVSFTEDGNLVITVEYKEDGPAGPAYYSYGMETNPNKQYDAGYEGYEQTYGYFEIRCKLPEGKGLNPAFWLLSDGMWADDTDGGVSGAEIDVIETKTDFEAPYLNSVYHTIHVDAYEEAHKQEIQGWFYADDPYHQYNTYGVEWNAEEYIFYVNGIETARTSFGGVCEVPLYLIISVGVNEDVYESEHLPAKMFVDYVRCYQYK